MKNKDEMKVNTKRELLLLILRWGSQYLPYSVISVENKINKFVNFFKNNRFSNWIKEVFMKIFGTPYPEYLFTDEPENNDIYIVDYKFFREGVSLVMDIVTADKPQSAKDFSRVFFLKKNFIRRMINSKLGYKFRYRKILTYIK